MFNKTSIIIKISLILFQEEGKTIKSFYFDFEFTIDFLKKHKNNTCDGFRIQKNDIFIEFYWLDCKNAGLPPTIINLLTKKFTNLHFHQKYKVIKRIGEGGFCSVSFHFFSFFYNYL